MTGRLVAVRQLTAAEHTVLLVECGSCNERLRLCSRWWLSRTIGESVSIVDGQMVLGHTYVALESWLFATGALGLGGADTAVFGGLAAA